MSTKLNYKEEKRDDKLCEICGIGDFAYNTLAKARQKVE
jgi:hypothetical protein